jgi:hypothetical protein
MNIGLFGDSYIDIVWHRYKNYQVPTDKKIWAQLLLEDLNAPFICSGLGGTSQYYAIQQWQQWSDKIEFDVAIFTLTWAHRLPTANYNEQIVTAYIEGRDVEKKNQLDKDIKLALDQYFKHLHNQQAQDFNYELMLKWCMELPAQYPKTRFIFIPNTKFAQNLAKKYYSQGVVLDVAMETLSAAEGELVGQAPYIWNRLGHLSAGAHEQFKEVVKKIILENQSGIVPVNIDDFGLTNLYPGYYDTPQ